MKKIVLGAVFLIFFAAVSTVYAHPPSDIEITFDPKTKVVTAVIVHNTSNSASHYIKKVDVGLNGKEIIEDLILKQDNNKTQAVSYLVADVKDGDVVSVEGYCNISGKLKKEIAIKF